MTPWWVIRKGAQWAGDKATNAGAAAEKLNAAADSPLPEERGPEAAGEGEPAGAESETGAETPVGRGKRLTPLRGAGTKSFIAMGDEALAFWRDALTQTYGYVEKPGSAGGTGTLTAGVGTDAGRAAPAGGNSAGGAESAAETDAEDTEGAEGAEGADTEDAEDSAGAEETGTSLRDVAMLLGLFVAPALIAFIARYGLKIINTKGRRTIMATKWEELLAAHGEADYSKATYAEGNIIDRSGLAGFAITTPYGTARSFGAPEHKAIDIAAPAGTPIQAPFDGYINYVDNVDDSRAGKYVEIATPDGLHIFRYLHLSAVPVRAGEKVRRGTVIGYSGNTYGGARRPDGTPWSSGAHVHLEYRRAGEKIAVGTSAYGLPLANPLAYGAEMPRTVDFAGGADVRVTFTNKTTIGTEGKNLMSVRDDGRSEWLGSIGFNKNRAGAFAAFDTYAHALRAGMISVQKYQTEHDVSDTGGRYTTINDIARNDKKHSYVDPRNGDRVEDWIKAVATYSGFAPDAPLNLQRTADLARLAQGISMAEHSALPAYEDVVSVIEQYSLTNDLISNTQPH